MNVLDHRHTRMKRSSLRQCCLASLAALTMFVSGCGNPLSANNKDNHNIRLPATQLADFLLTHCDDLWQLRTPESDNNPLYWLRAMECSQRLSETQARQLAARFSSADNDLTAPACHGQPATPAQNSPSPNAAWQTTTHNTTPSRPAPSCREPQNTDNRWPDTLRQAILLTQVKMTPEHRQRYLTSINTMANSIPAQIWPVFQLWHDTLVAQQALISQKNRYHKLQQTSDTELDNLRQQLQDTRQQLSQTTHKLESLTDIERQLSSRKASDNFSPSTPHSPANTDSNKPADSKTDRPAAQNQNKKTPSVDPSTQKTPQADAPPTSPPPTTDSTQQEDKP